MEPDWEAIPIRGAGFLRKMGPVAVLVVIILIVLAFLSVTSIVKIGGTQVGIVEKKLGGGSLPAGRVIAVKGENGIQAQVLAPGWHFFYWPWQYGIKKVQWTQIKEGQVGLVTAKDGQTLPPDTIYAPEWPDPDKMIDAAYFLSEGNGYKGPQLSVLNPGAYRLNTDLFEIKQVTVINVRVGTVAVVKSNVGRTVETEDRLVAKGQRGIWNKPLGEGQYYLNTNAYEVTLISIRQTKVSYTAEVERGEAGSAQPLKPITVRSADGFTFPVDVRITYRIDPENAPRVVAMIGDDALILDKLVTPRVRATFRNNAEKVKALAYVQNRSVQEQQSASMLREDLAEYGITLLEISIGDIGDEKSLGALLKTQTDREIALQEQATFEEQQRAAEKKKALTKTTQEAEEEKRLATATYDVSIAEQDKQKKIIAAQGEAEMVRIVAEAKARAFELVSNVIGPDNAALIEVLKMVSESNMEITPEVMVTGQSSGMTDALMGTILKGMLNKQGSGVKAGK